MKLKAILTLHKTVLTINRRNIDYIYPCNPRKYYFLADDKLATKQWLEKLNIPVPHTYTVVNSFKEINPAIGLINKLKQSVIKPAKGKGGGGILLIINRDGQLTSPGGTIITIQQIRSHLADIIFGNYSFGITDKAIIEELITPHPTLGEFFEKGVPDIRIIVHKGNPILAMARFPTSYSKGKANLHAGGIGVGIDMNTGRLTQGFWKGRYLDSHPDTGKPFAGTAVPYWQDIILIAKTIGRHSPLKYIGIDIVVGPAGPVVMEINIRPGLEIQNVNKTGLRKLL